jgi:hypothetical protein
MTIDFTNLRRKFNDMQIMEAKVNTNGESTVIRDYVCGKLEPIHINPFVKAYSVTFKDGLCFFGVLTLLTRGLNVSDTQSILAGRDTDLVATPEQSYHMATLEAKRSGDVLGHDAEYIDKVCAALKLPVIDMNGLQAYCDLGANLELKAVNGYNSLPAVLKVDGSEGQPGHVVLLVAPGARK